MGFKDFKANQEKIREALEKQKQEDAKSASYVDERFFQLKTDDVGNANVLMRFLPQKNPAKAPYIKTLSHGFQHKGKWFIEECPWTIKETCPVCMYVRENDFWKSNIALAKKYSARPWFIANVLIIKDDNCPENNGKVFLYKFGNMFQKMIDKAMSPSEEDLEDSPHLAKWMKECGNIFDFDAGFNFRLKVSKKTITDPVSGEKKAVNDYDEAKFRMIPTPLCDGDEAEQEKVYNQIHDLDEFLDPKRFKNSEDLSKKFFDTINFVPTSAQQEDKAESKPAEQKQEKATSAPAHTQQQAAPTEAKSKKSDDDDIDYDALLGDDIPF